MKDSFYIYLEEEEKKRKKINWVYDEGEANNMIEWTRNEMNVCGFW